MSERLFLFCMALAMAVLAAVLVGFLVLAAGH